MSEQERLARQWAERVMTTTLEKIDPVQRAAAEYILATTAPPTMAGVDWDHEKHHLAGAVFQNAGTTAEVVMFHKDGTGAIIAVDVEDGRPFIGDASKYTPNGKRYELREVGKPDRPEYLETLEDYWTAPEGTIVAEPEGDPYMAKDCKWKLNAWPYPATYVAGTPRAVLRWGWGGEA